MAVIRNGSGSGTSISAATVTPRATSSFAETGLPTTSSARDAIPRPPGLIERFRDAPRHPEWLSRRAGPRPDASGKAIVVVCGRFPLRRCRYQDQGNCLPQLDLRFALEPVRRYLVGAERQIRDRDSRRTFSQDWAGRQDRGCPSRWLRGVARIRRTRGELAYPTSLRPGSNVGEAEEVADPDEQELDADRD